ncbi:SAM-dependent methyltransferase [Streptomonospora litoralis]|uniref:S-adenosyl methyltransferase n=1 Tax=Streptomonospora litoralis TaxID=2498135 RepID=A0A4V0ZJS1_9ACTN|nr:SAM-dependent methyltransferase [Streptomonospora litoralis]QBI54462.1 S-adenosyl methyltransferase [Streptomonospora litoralis]
MADDTDDEAASAPPSVDTTVPHSARVWNYWLGGKDNYAADREVAEQYRAVFPEISDQARHGRGFIKRSVTYLVGEAGIRQFLDIGTGMPTAENTHEVAQHHAPESAIVYVDNDPLVLAHANALLVGTPEGRTDYLHADLREPEDVIAKAHKTLDFDRPIALMLMGVLGHIGDDDVHPVVSRLVSALPPGSYLALYDGTDSDPRGSEAQEQYNRNAPLPYWLRSPEWVASVFGGLEMVAPGFVPCPQWRPEAAEVGAAQPSMTRCGVARKL